MQEQDQEMDIVISDETIVLPSESAPEVSDANEAIAEPVETIPQEGFSKPAPSLHDETPSSQPSEVLYSAEDTPATGAPIPPAAVEPKHSNRPLSVIFAWLVAVIGCGAVFGGSYDNDIWFILATGEEIINNGIPFINPFSIHENLSIVIQQWPVCIINYLIYSHLGFVGLGVWVLILYGLFSVSLYRLGMYLKGDGFGAEIVLLAMIPVLYGMSSYMSVRPHLYTMLAFVWTVFFLEHYRRSGRIAWLIPLPFIVAIHINFQAAMAPFDLVIMVCYLIPDVLHPFHARGKLQGFAFTNATYRRIPILVVLVLSALALLANPYVVDGALYLVNSYGAAGYRDRINEMQPTSPASSLANTIVTLVIFVAAICVGVRGAKRIDLPLLLLAIGTSCLGFMHVRNRWLPLLFCLMFILWATHGTSIRLFAKMAYRNIVIGVVSAIGAIACVVLLVVSVPILEEEPENNSFTPVAAMDYLDKVNANKETTRVFTFFNAGGYIEYRGYKVNMDPRPELWNSSISNVDEDYYFEYVDMVTGDIKFNDYAEKYDFDVYIIPKNDNATKYFSGNWDYTQIPSGDDYYAYVKRGLFMQEG